MLPLSRQQLTLAASPAIFAGTRPLPSGQVNAALGLCWPLLVPGRPLAVLVAREGREAAEAAAKAEPPVELAGHPH